MINDNINNHNLKRISHINPLFQKCFKAFHNSSLDNSQNTYIQENFQKRIYSYIVINSTKKITQLIFQCKNICPVFISGNQSFILTKGQNLWDFYRSQKQHQVILTQEQLCAFIRQIVQALIHLSKYQYVHPHLKEYAIYRNSPYDYQLIFHPQIKSMLQLAQSNKFYWYDFYLSPQQLKADSYMQYAVNQKDTVFSLGLLLLNVMNPTDFNRDVYLRNKFQINWEIINQKIKNCKRKYSTQLINLVQNCLKQFNIQRWGFKQILDQINLIIQTNKKLDFNFHNKISYLIKSRSNSKHSSKHSSKQQSPNLNQQTELYKINKNKQKKQLLINEKRSQKAKKWNENIKSQQKKLENNVSEFQQTNCKNKTRIQYIFGEQNQFSEINFHRGTFGGQNNPKHTTKNYQKQNVTQKTLKYNNNKFLSIQQTKNQEQNILPTFGQSLENNNKLSIQNLQENIHFQFKEEQFDQIKRKIEQYKSYIKKRQKQISLNIKDCLKPLDQLQKIVADQSPGIYIEGNIYFGSFKNGRRNGLGLQLFPEGEYFFGNFKDDLFHGQGFYFWNKNQSYLGIFQNGKKIFGTLNGAKLNFIGQFNGQKKMSGIGKAFYKTGQIFIGQWLNGKKNGIGQLQELTGDKFIGKWSKGKKNGLGQYLSNDFPKNGYSLKSYWKGQEILNNVYIQYSNGNIYQGPLVNFQKHGLGYYKFKNGHFKGTFYKDQATHGQLIYKNGQKYIGSLKNMKRHGYGQYHYLDGDIKKGNWIQDVRVQKKNQNQNQLNEVK